MRLVEKPGMFPPSVLWLNKASSCWIGVISLVMLLHAHRVDALRNQNKPNKSAECEKIINSRAEKSGEIDSPGFPRPYPQNTSCTYIFQGDKSERVRIEFQQFDLGPVTKDDIVDEKYPCRTMDKVSVYVHDPGTEEQDKIDDFCGQEIPMAVMSTGNVMTVQFDGRRNPRKKNKGFRAKFSFLTDFGMSSGDQKADGICEFTFNSSSMSNGTISSPNFPGYYPRNTRCDFFFFGQDNEIVDFQFKYFDVEGRPPCTDQEASDFLEFSNFYSIDRGMPKLCGHQKPKPIASDSSFFRVTFRSNHQFDGTGFQVVENA
ncbi:unnamed protein product [Cyprideis torosa]|uniref:Uncharacterized protein n=1 Tax=Cyprideis torosa TaxID=163714 RepID=A0A7R8ZP75_9CRUS|nr:unnamed protein product [Cyprideis torosa]CAG0889229.1 unnamed protein product [Cyprideis torosa]